MELTVLKETIEAMTTEERAELRAKLSASLENNTAENFTSWASTAIEYIDNVEG